MKPNHIVDLIQDIQDLEKKHSFRRSINIFEAAGLSRQETKHSRMLSFLIDPSRNHGLGANILKSILLDYHQPNFPSVAQIILGDLDDWEVYCEWRNIDILLASKSLKIVVAIENKIDAREAVRDGLSQLTKYRNLLETEPAYTEFSKLYIYLTPDGDEPTDQQWEIMLYSDILEYVKKAYDETHGQTSDSELSAAKFAVQQYIEFLKRNVVMDPQLIEDCQSIYRKHRDILDALFLIVKQGGDFSDAGNQFAAQSDCAIYAIRGGDKRLAFLPNALAAIFPDSLNKPWWDQLKPIICWFDYTDPKTLKLIFQVGPMSDIEARTALVEELRGVFRQNQNRAITDKYTTVYSQKAGVNEDEPDLLGKMLHLYGPVKEKIEQVAAAAHMLKG